MPTPCSQNSDAEMLSSPASLSASLTPPPGQQPPDPAPPGPQVLAESAHGRGLGLASCGLEPSHTHPGCPAATGAELRFCDGDLWLAKSEIFTSQTSAEGVRRVLAPSSNYREMARLLLLLKGFRHAVSGGRSVLSPPAGMNPRPPPQTPECSVLTPTEPQLGARTSLASPEWEAFPYHCHFLLGRVQTRGGRARSRLPSKPFCLLLGYSSGSSQGRD